MSTIVAFTPDQVCRVTSLSRRQLRYWDDTGFFTPGFAADRRRFARMYSFRDVVGLRTIATLRHELPLQELRRIGAWLHERYEEPWANLQFFVVGRRVVFEDAKGFRGVAGSHQMALRISLSDVERETEIAANGLLHREGSQVGNIVRNRYVQYNAWVLDGTRIPTLAIWDFHLAGFDVQSICREYPRLTEVDVCSAIEFERQRTS